MARCGKRIETGRTIVNIDIGGGTSKIAVCEAGRIAELTAIDIGARLLAVDEAGKLVRIEEAGRRFAAEAGVALELGAVLGEPAMRAIAACMADRLARGRVS